MIGYKAFESDMTCRGYQYEVGKSYEMDGEIKLCESGFHFCENIADCFTYYDQVSARFAKIEAYGKLIRSDKNSKCVTNKIRILEEIPRDEALRMSNSGRYNSGWRNPGDQNSGNRNSGDQNSGNWNPGDQNSGDHNSGSRNSGYWNSGDYNSGDYNSGNQNSGTWNSGDWNSGGQNSGNCNSGDHNSGDWNSGDWNSGDWNKSSCNNGCFMTIQPTIMMFNKPTEWTLMDWWNSEAHQIMSNCPTAPIGTTWISESDMTAKEKAIYPEYITTGGYLKNISHKADKQKWWDKLDNHKKEIVMGLPNFDPDIFLDCTGIRVEVEDK